MVFDKQLLLATIAANALGTVAADSIYDIAKEAGDDFSILVAAVDASAVGPAGPNLVDALSDDDGTFTIFAPLNSAFEAIPEELIEKLLDPIWQPQLQDFLLYHALGSEVRSTDLSDGLTADTLNGGGIIINLDPPRVNGYANILVEEGLVDIEADNGVIHVIDSVLAPQSVAMNIIDLAAGSSLAAALEAADLLDALSGEGPFTVFAPSDEAFDALPEGKLDALLDPNNKDALTDILLYHVIEANAHSAGLSSGNVETLNGDYVEVTVSGAGVMVNDANVEMADIIASNGIIHVIDSVLLPPTDEQTEGSTTRSKSQKASKSNKSSKNSKGSSKAQKRGKMDKKAKMGKKARMGRKRSDEGRMPMSNRTKTEWVTGQWWIKQENARIPFH